MTIDIDVADCFLLTVATTGKAITKIKFKKPPDIDEAHKDSPYGKLAVFRPIHIWLTYSGDQKPNRLVNFENVVWEGGIAPILSVSKGSVDALYFEHFWHKIDDEFGPWLGNIKGLGYK